MYKIFIRSILLVLGVAMLTSCERVLFEEDLANTDPFVNLIISGRSVTTNTPILS